MIKRLRQRFRIDMQIYEYRYVFKRLSIHKINVNTIPFCIIFS